MSSGSCSESWEVKSGLSVSVRQGQCIGHGHDAKGLLTSHTKCS